MNPHPASSPPQAALPDEIAALERVAARLDVDIDGRRVAFRRFGNGGGAPPLVLLHGGHGSWLHWVRNITALREAGRVLWVPDMPGFGDSDALAGPPHAADRRERLVAMLAHAVDHLVGASTPIDLAGFSFGGLMAAHLAGSRGGVRRLALLGAAGHGTPRRPRAALIEWRLDDRAARLAALRHNLWAHMIGDPARVDELAMQVHERSCERTRFRSKEVSLSGSLAEALAGFGVPVLAIWGEHDSTATPLDAAARFAATGPARAGEVLPDAGHWLQYEQAAAVNARLLDWFGAR